MRNASISGRLLPLALAAGLLLATHTQLAAQSLLANRGLGWVVQPTDARARGLGGVSLGLLGGELGWTNPADAVGMPAPGLKVGFEYDAFSAEYGERSSDGGTARFPLILGGFPIGSRGVVTVGAAGYLDQNWAIEREDTLLIDTDTVPVLDRFTSEGGVTQLRLGAGYAVLSSLSLGVGVDLYLGGTEREAGRLFPREARPRCCREAWTYSGTGGVVGLEWSPGEALAVAGSVSFGGTLEAESRDTVGNGASFSIPTRGAVGASGRVATDLLVALSGEWTGWGTLAESLQDTGGARDAWSLHGGAEWEGAQLADRPLPVRLGVRYAALPFGWAGPGEPEDWVDERALTGGLGLLLANGAVRGDVALDRGRRSGDDFGESFWRMSFSVTVLGR